MRPLRLLVAQDLPDQRGVRHELVLVHSSRHGAISAARSASQDGISDRRSVLGGVSPHRLQQKMSSVSEAAAAESMAARFQLPGSARDGRAMEPQSDGSKESDGGEA
jgi:hypothetical protein